MPVDGTPLVINVALFCFTVLQALPMSSPLKACKVAGCGEDLSGCKGVCMDRSACACGGGEWAPYSFHGFNACRPGCRLNLIFLLICIHTNAEYRCFFGLGLQCYAGCARVLPALFAVPQAREQNLAGGRGAVPLLPAMLQVSSRHGL